MNQELKNQAHRDFSEIEVALTDHIKDDIEYFIDSLIDKTVQKTEERIVDLIERQYGDVVTTNKDVAIPHNCLEYETALDDIITLITNKSDINKDTL